MTINTVFCFSSGWSEADGAAGSSLPGPRGQRSPHLRLRHRGRQTLLSEVVQGRERVLPVHAGQQTAEPGVPAAGCHARREYARTSSY